MVLYFAYGSNMDENQMEQRCTAGFDVLGVARLEGYRIDFTKYSNDWEGGVADIIEEPGAYVEGVVFDLPDASLEDIDRYEGVSEGMYRRIDISVTMRGSGERLDMLSYEVIDKSESTIQPSGRYIGQILKAAQKWRFSEGYIHSLSRF